MQSHQTKFGVNLRRRMLLESIEILTNTGDWHTRLVASLVVAHSSVQSDVTRGMIEQLVAHLEEFDECSHRLTRTVQIPPWLDPHLLMDRIQEELISDGLRMELDKQSLHITALVRGTCEHAEQKLTGAIDDALAGAKRAFLREL